MRRSWRTKRRTWFFAQIHQYGQRDATFGDDPTADGVVSTDFDRKRVNPINPELVQHFNEDFITSLALGPGGEIVAAGWAGAANWNTDDDLSDAAFARYDKNGIPDTTFGALDGDERTGRITWDVSDTDGEAVTGIALQRDGRVVAAVSGAMAGNAYLVRLNADGTPDNGLANVATPDDAFGDNNVFRPGTAALTGMEVPGGVVITPDGIAATGYNGNPEGDLVVGLHAREDAGAVNLRRGRQRRDNRSDVECGGQRRRRVRSPVVDERRPCGAAEPESFDDVHVDFVDADTTIYVDRDAVPGTRYFYRVFGLLGGAHKGGSNVASAVAVHTNTKYVWQETVWVPVTGDPKTSKTTLLKDHDYQLRASGEYALSPTDYGPPNTGPTASTASTARGRTTCGRTAPAASTTASTLPRTSRPASPAPNDHPFWGEPSDSADHGYTIGYRGNGKATFRYRDDYYGDNQTGYLMKVEVYKAVPSTPTSLSAGPPTATRYTRRSP